MPTWQVIWACWIDCLHYHVYRFIRQMACLVQIHKEYEHKGHKVWEGRCTRRSNVRAFRGGRCNCVFSVIDLRVLSITFCLVSSIASYFRKVKKTRIPRKNVKNLDFIPSPMWQYQVGHINPIHLSMYLYYLPSFLTHLSDRFFSDFSFKFGTIKLIERNLLT